MVRVGLAYGVTLSSCPEGFYCKRGGLNRKACLVLDDALPADEGLGGERFQAEECEVLGEGLCFRPTLLHLAEAVGGDALEPATPVDEDDVGRPPRLIP